MFGLVGLVALALLFVVLAFPAVKTLVELVLVAMAAVGIYAIVGSPYWSIVYRESPLRRAVSGISDLDERELALRDRANGLTYYIFATANVVIIAFCLSGVKWNWFVLDEDVLLAALLPYGWFAVTLPVIMLEWFEPSGAAPDPVEEKE
jgi:hypothetical protein